jgi:uncharacterized membrane protein
MRTLRVGTHITAVVLLAFDVTFAVQTYFHGWPMTAAWTETEQGERAVRMTRASLTPADWSMLAGLILLHILVIYGLWRLRRRHENGRLI